MNIMGGFINILYDFQWDQIFVSMRIKINNNGQYEKKHKRYKQEGLLTENY